MTGNILDDEELIETLSSSKIMGTKIEEQVKQQEITAVQIAEVRQVYKHFCCKEVMVHHRFARWLLGFFPGLTQSHPKL